jgi:Fe-S-cluster containining protein
MAHVRGPFIEYECSSCGVTCQENAPRNHDRLINRIVEANTHAAKRVCAACWQPIPAGRAALEGE